MGLSFEDLFPTPTFNVGAGWEEWLRNIAEQELALTSSLGQAQFGAGLLNQLIGVQADPFSIVPALQAYSAVGGPSLGPTAAFAASGGVGQPSPYGDLVDQLIKGLGQFATGAGAGAGVGQPEQPPPTSEFPGLPPAQGGSPLPAPSPNQPPVVFPPKAILTPNGLQQILQQFVAGIPVDAVSLRRAIAFLETSGAAMIGNAPADLVASVLTTLLTNPKAATMEQVQVLIQMLQGAYTPPAPTASPSTSPPASPTSPFVPRSPSPSPDIRSYNVTSVSNLLKQFSGGF